MASILKRLRRAVRREADKPLFTSLDAAMRWAYHYQPETRQKSALARLMGESDDTEHAEGKKLMPNPYLDRRPAGLDASAQVGLIKSFVNRQDDPTRIHLLSKYAMGEERNAARRAIRDWILPLLETALRPRNAIYHLVCVYYGKPNVDFQGMASRIEYLMPSKGGRRKRMEEAADLIGTLNRNVDRVLKDMATRVEELAHAELQKLGVIT